MKKYLLLPLFFVAFSLMFASCDKKNNEPNGDGGNGADGSDPEELFPGYPIKFLQNTDNIPFTEEKIWYKTYIEDVEQIICGTFYMYFTPDSAFTNEGVKYYNYGKLRMVNHPMGCNGFAGAMVYHSSYVFNDELIRIYSTTRTVGEGAPEKLEEHPLYKLEEEYEFTGENLQIGGFEFLNIGE